MKTEATTEFQPKKVLTRLDFTWFNSETVIQFQLDITRKYHKITSVGLIIAMDNLEHLENDSNGILEFYQALKYEYSFS